MFWLISLKIIHTYLKIITKFQKYHNDQCFKHLHAHGIWKINILPHVTWGSYAWPTAPGNAPFILDQFLQFRVVTPRLNSYDSKSVCDSWNWVSPMTPIMMCGNRFKLQSKKQHTAKDKAVLTWLFNPLLWQDFLTPRLNFRIDSRDPTYTQNWNS